MLSLAETMFLFLFVFRQKAIIANASGLVGTMKLLRFEMI